MPAPHSTVMPDRSVKVRAMCAAHPEAFPVGEGNDAARLAFLKSTIIPTLNIEDQGQWGYMTKTDQGDKVPCDVLMWKSGGVVDCMTGTGGTWIVLGPPPPEWVWTAVGTTPTPEPPPSGGTPPPSSTLAYDEGQVNAFLQDEVAAYQEANRALDAQYPIWCARMQYDAFAMGYAAAREKQLKECRHALGLS
jgi:hypothetical protein